MPKVKRTWDNGAINRNIQKASNNGNDFVIKMNVDGGQNNGPSPSKEIRSSIGNYLNKTVTSDGFSTLSGENAAFQDY